MGEVDQLQNAVDHGVAQGNQGIDAPEHQAIENLLKKDVHGLEKKKPLSKDRGFFNTAQQIYLTDMM